MKYRIPTVLLALLFTVACGRAEFGSPTKGGVVDSDVERETPNSSDDFGDGSSFNGGAGPIGEEANNVSDPGTSPPQPSDERAFTTDFAFDAYAELAAQGRNAVFAPHGVARSLVIAHAAASPETADDVAAVLEGYLGGDFYGGFNSADLDYEQRESAQTFEMFSAVWAQEDVAVEQDFLDVIGRYTGLELRLLDFAGSPEDARNTMNNWFSGETDGRISEVVGPRAVDAETRFVVTDATWFASPWGFGPFDADRTTYANFAGSESDVQLPMMAKDGVFLHIASPDFDGVVMPLQGGFSMMAVVPEDLEAFESMVSGDFLDRLMGEAVATPMTLHFPKIEVSDRVQLSQVAEAVGVSELFADGAEYNGFADETTLDDAHHRTRIRFDETGVAVDASMDDGDLGAGEANGLEVRFDQPFFFAIRDGETGQYFLLGRVAQP